jgi:hypothetical protein
VLLYVVGKKAKDIYYAQENSEQKYAGKGIIGSLQAA